jgi:hypothetical protein
MMYFGVSMNGKKHRKDTCLSMKYMPRVKMVVKLYEQSLKHTVF